MSLFQKKTYESDQDRKLSVMVYWLFVVAVFAWVIPFTLLFVLGMVNQALGVGNALTFALTPSLITFVVSCILCVAVYFGYKKLVLKV